MMEETKMMLSQHSNSSRTSSRSRGGGMILTYPGWEEDKAIAEQYFATSRACQNNDGSTVTTTADGCTSTTPRPGSLFHKKIDAMKNRQRLFEGDRSHKEIVELDRLQFTYDGWEVDQEEAIQIHCGNCSVLYLGKFKDKLDIMKRKESIHQNRHSFDALRELDEQQFTYAGIEKDLVIAESLFVQHPDLQLFHKKLEAMKIKQAVLVGGDKSHPDIVALEREVFTYDDWQVDKEDAMQRILGDCNVQILGEFPVKLQEMKRKEQAFQSQTRAAELQYLECLRLSYPECQQDKEDAKRLYLEYCCSGSPITMAKSWFHQKVKGMKVKQRLFDGDRSDVLELDSAEFTYPDWESDKQRAMQRITGDCSISFLGTFQDVFAEMRNKQELHTNRQNIKGIQYLDSLFLHQHANLKASDAGDTDDTESSSSCSASEAEATPDKNGDINIGENVCVVCFESEPSHAYIPCGHRCICSDCAELHDASSRGDDGSHDLKCPICREPTLCIMRIFL